MEIMSTFLRWKLGWIQPTEVTLSDGQEQTFTLSDIGENGDAGCLVVHTTSPDQDFLLECRDSTAAIYDNGNVGGCDDGTRGGSGLLISHVSHINRPTNVMPNNCTTTILPVRGWWWDLAPGNEQVAPGCADPECECGLEACPNQVYAPNVDIEFATGLFDTVTWAPDPVYGWDSMSHLENAPFGYAHDAFFRPQGVNIFAPYTNPSTNLYYVAGVSEDIHDLEHCPYRQDQSVYSGLTFYNIEWETPPGGGNGEISVTIRYDATQPSSGSPYQLADGMVWDGLVQLMADVEVPAGRTLTIEEGSRVVLAAEQDHQAAGHETGYVQIGVKGQILVGDSLGDPVEIFSSRSDSFVHYAFDSLGGALETDSGQLDSPTDAWDWSGFDFDLSGTYVSNYGLMGADEPLSTLSNVTIEDGRYGMRIRNSIAPTLAGVTFQGIAADTAVRHIYLEDADVFVPAGTFWHDPGPGEDVVIPPAGTWDLTPGTQVVASNAAPDSALDIWFGTAGKIDLVGQGRVRAFGAEGDSVYFRPEVQTAAGDGWGGLILDGMEYDGHILEFADLSFAATPLYIYQPDSTYVQDCRLHDFAAVGLWVESSDGLGGVIESNTIDRGSVLDQTLGYTGLIVDEAYQLTVTGNRIDMSGFELLSGTSTAPSVDVFWSKDVCSPPPAGSSTLLIEDNYITGPDIDAGGLHAGVLMSWLCPNASKTVTVVRNYIEELSRAGLQFYQTQSVQVDSNTVVSSKRAVKINSTDAVLSAPAAKFKANWFEVLDPDEGEEVLVTDNKAFTTLGPSSSVLGDNALKVVDENVNFMRETDTTSVSVKLVTEDCYWFLETSGGEVFLNHEDPEDPYDEIDTELKPRLKPFSSDFDYTPWQPDSTSMTYYKLSDVPEVGRLSSSGGSRGGSSAEFPEAAPSVSFVSPPLGNPARGSVSFVLGVAPDDEGRYTVEIFAVTGRRVAVVLDRQLGAGSHAVRWDGISSSGTRPASGVYFVRVDGPGIRRTQKVTVLR